jgi:hypothetical protein
MGDIILTPRRTAGILKELDLAARSVSEARQQVIEAMAERKRAATPTHQKKSSGRGRAKPK